MVLPNPSDIKESHPTSSCLWWCCRAVVVAEVGQGVAVAPPVPGDIEVPPHEQLLAGVGVVS
jgi:hypothetical protein